MQEQLEEIRSRALRELGEVTEWRGLDEWRVRYLGRKGTLTTILRGIGALPAEERPVAGGLANEIKTALENALDDKEKALRQAEVAKRLETERVDVTLPGRPMHLGGLHPTTKMVRETVDVFVRLGFQVVEGPEVEWDYYNFEALNIPKDHPARDMWDTLWVSPEGSDAQRPILLRTHTSPMQARFMETHKPPVRVVVPGKCYRFEATDATHEWMFHQIEGLAVDEGITFADLKGTLYEFAKQIFGTERKVRFRCDYFPFVEPGVDMSIDCFSCRGSGCRLCGLSGWLEIMGAGMVHPRVLENVGYDPRKFTGFAFGMGLERIAMLKHGIDDIRLFYGNDLRFLGQFAG